MEVEADRRSRFLKTLEEIEFQAGRLALNRNINKLSLSTLMQERAVLLMVGIIKFLNSALLYFSRTFFGKISSRTLKSHALANVITSVVRGQQIYDSAEASLRDAIRRYNEALGDFTASCVIGIHLNNYI